MPLPTICYYYKICSPKAELDCYVIYVIYVIICYFLLLTGLDCALFTLFEFGLCYKLEFNPEPDYARYYY